MTKINSSVKLNDNWPVILKSQKPVAPETFFPGFTTQDNLVLKKQIVFVNTKPASINQSKDFKTVFPNFNILDKTKQDEVVKKISLIQEKYPDFISKLAKIDNPQYGNGFQFFFVPEKDKKEYTTSPGIAIIDKAMGTNSSGIVFGGTGGILENSILKTPIAKISQSIINNGIMGHKFDTSRITLDVGGMFTSSSENTFAHEMGHVIHSYFLSNSERAELWSIYIRAKENNKFLTDYSRTNHMEFFGEAVESYLQQDDSGNFTDRENLKKSNKELYDFTARVIDPKINKARSQSTFKSLITITEYGLENGYNAGKTFVSSKIDKLKDLF
jgi:hypothetical protein